MLPILCQISFRMLSMRNSIFQRLPALEPLNRFSKNFAPLITSVTPPHTQIFRSVGPKGASLHMREIVIVRRLFFSFRFFSFMRIATGPPIGPINAVNGLNDAFWWHEHSLYGLVKEIGKLPLPAPKIWKFALWPMATSKRHNSGTIKDTCKMFAPNRGFSGSGNQTVSFKFLLNPPLLPWQHADVIWRQNWPACIRNITKILAPNRGFSFRGRPI